MNEIVVHIPAQEAGGYPIVIGTGILSGLLARIDRQFPKKAMFIVTDESLVRAGHFATLTGGRDMPHYVIQPAGEQSKHLGTLSAILEAMEKHRLARDTVVIGLGGGTVGDIAGFAAAVFKRGVPVVHIPTTTVAQADSSIGGKTGVDLRDAKNIIGAFHHPVAVIIDPAVLKTLPRRHFNNGMAEAIKTAAIGDATLFAFIEKNAAKIKKLEPFALEHLITQCCRFKAKIVSRDERESGVRAILNFGHTVGHGVEAASRYRILHGEAVAIGMVAASRIAESLGLCSGETTRRLAALLKEFSLPTDLSRVKGISVDAILGAMKSDKKIRGGKFTFILPLKIGKVLIKRNVAARLVGRTLRGL